MDNAKMKNIISTYVNEEDDVSFVEIEHLFEEYTFDYKGDYAICPDNKNIILWNGWNEISIQLILELKKENLIDLEFCSTIIYMIDGKAINLPIAKKPYQYKTEHWLPTLITRKEC